MRNILLSLTVLLIMSCATTTDAPKVDTDTNVYYLVRHAEKEGAGTNDPQLTAEGERRAKNLRDLLASQRITHVYSTNYIRTKQTAIPLARRIRIPLSIYNASDLEAFALELSELKGAKVLVVGHSNTTPALANLLLGEEKYATYDESEYSNLITISKSASGTNAKMSKF